MLKVLFSPRFFGVFLITSIFFQDFSFSKILIQNEEGASHGHSHGDGSAPEANGEGSYRANDFWKDSKNVSASNGCPSYLIEQVKEDSKIGIRNWVGKKSGSSDDYCSNALSKLTDTPDAAELSKRLASHPMTSFGDKGESLSESCLSSVQDPERKKLLVAEYHSNTARLKMASLSSLENMAAIDSILGKNSLQDVDCSQSGMPHLEGNCKKLKSCQARGGLEQQAKEIQDIYPQYIALKKEVSNLNSSNALSAMSMGSGYVSNPAQISAMKERSDKSSENQKKILALEAMYPALTGKVFNSTFDPSKQNFQEALRSQFEKSRQKISEQFNDYQKGIRCMSGKSGSCDHFDKTMKSAPPLNIQAFKRGAGLSVEDSHVQSYLGAVECRQKIREVHENQNEALKDLAVGTALTIGTMGLGSIAATAKLASTSAETAVQAAQFASRARMASNALVGVDLVSLGQGGKEAYEHCSKSLNQFSGAQPKNDSSKTEASCPSDSGSSAIPQLSADYRACVAQVLLQGVTNGLPLVPGAVAGAKNVLGSAEKGALSAEKSLAREGAILEKETSSEVKGLAPSRRDAETRLAEMTPEKRALITENMALSDGDRSAKIAKDLNLPIEDPRVNELMNLHADAKYSKTLEGSTDELQGKINEAMEILHPGYKDLVGPSRNAFASERVNVKELVSNGVLGMTNSNVSLPNAFRKAEDERLMGLLTSKDKEAFKLNFTRGAEEYQYLDRFFDQKSSSETRSGSARLIAETLRDSNPEASRAFYSQALTEHNLAAQQKFGRPLSEDSKYFNFNRNAREYVDVAAHVGDQKAVNMGIKKEVDEFFGAQSKHMGWGNKEDAAVYLLDQEERQQIHMKGIKRTISEEAAIRKQKALIDAYPDVKKSIGEERVNKINAAFGELKIVESVVSTPSVAAPLPKAPEVIPPTKVPDPPAIVTLEAPKPQPPANAPKDSIAKLADMEKSKDLSTKLTYARMATDASVSGEASVDVAQYALKQLKENPEFLKDPKIVGDSRSLDSLVSVAAHAQDEVVLKEAIQMKIQNELIQEWRAKHPNDKNIKLSQNEIGGRGGEYILDLEQQTTQASIYNNPVKLDAIRQQQKVLYELYQDSFAYRDPVGRYKRSIFDHFKPKK